MKRLKKALAVLLTVSALTTVGGTAASVIAEESADTAETEAVDITNFEWDEDTVLTWTNGDETYEIRMDYGEVYMYVILGEGEEDEDDEYELIWYDTEESLSELVEYVRGIFGYAREAWDWMESSNFN